MNYKNVKYEMFGGEDAEMYNALQAAFAENAGGIDGIYEWLDKTPKTTIVVSLVDTLKEMGYGITKVQ